MGKLLRIRNLFRDCVDCPNRRIGCHAKCESYKRDKAEHNEIRNRMIASEKAGCSHKGVMSKKQNHRGKWISCVVRKNGI